MPRYRQEVVNVKIAELLRKAGFKEVVAEVITKGNLPDVMINVSGVRVVLEGWFEKSVSPNVLKDKCRKRIEDNICDLAIGIFYPDSLREAKNEDELINKIKQSEFEAFIFYPSSKGVVDQALGKVSFEQLAENINYLYSQVVKTDLLREKIIEIERAIQDFSNILLTSGIFFSSEKVIEELKKVLGIEEKALKAKFVKEDLIKVALFIIFDGLLFHQVLSSHYTHIKGLDKAPETNVLNFIKEEWKKIMEINYLPIFVLAFEVVNCLPPSPSVDKIFEIFKSVVLEVISSGVLLKHDLMGRVYHKLLLMTTGEFYASYYTSIPAAILLSNLTVKTENPDLEWDFGNLEELKKMRIVDPACGSGTLLSAIYMAFKNEYILEHYRREQTNKLNLTKFHKLMIEEVLHGWDILDYAGHLTLLTLAFHNPRSFFNRCNVYILPSGKDKNGKIYLGSLSLLENNLVGYQYLFEELNMESKEKSIKEERVVQLDVPPSSMDVVIMNPPFSRSAGDINIKFGYVEEEVRKEMNEKLRRLGEGLSYQQIGQAGLGAYFIILGDKLLKQGGRLSLVIPRALLSGVSWEEIRKLLFRDYEIEYIVSNYDPGDRELDVEPWNWSENTDLGEVLIVARKTNKPLENRITTFINLWNKPNNELESLKIASDSVRIRKSLDPNSFINKGNYEILKIKKEVGSVYNVPQKYLKRNFLMFCTFAHPDLNRFVFSLVHQNLFNLASLSTLVEGLGVDRKQISETFERVETTTPYKILWGTSVLMSTLELHPSYIRYGKLKRGKRDAIYRHSANFLIAENLHLRTERLTAMISEERILATTFWEVQTDIETAKILTLWFNSTFGVLILLSHSINSQGDRFIIKKGHLENLPVIDVRLLSDEEKENFLKLYDELKDKQFSTFPEEFELASKGMGIRKRIDDEFIKLSKRAINLQRYYEMLAKDPVLNLRRL